MGRSTGTTPPVTPIDLGYGGDLQHSFSFCRGEKLGKGGFGVVRLVERLTTREKFACKEIRKHLDAAIATHQQQLRHVENIQREVAVLQKLKGSLNVVSLEGVFEDETSVYIVTECCFGGELLHTIGIRPYSEQMVARIMKAALRTLAQCHERGILHRDVKPGNFMFLRDDVNSPIKAIDFGLAVFFEEGELPRRDLGFDGTPWFMAPEVLSSQVVPASDVWSAGVMAYQLLSGVLPFDDRQCRHAPALSAVWSVLPNQFPLFEGERLRKSVLSDAPSFSRKCWKEISDEAKDFIQQLLQKDPWKRPTAVEALSHVWIEKGSKPNLSAPHLPHTLVQRIQRFGQSSLFKRTVLDMIANELLQFYVEKTRYNEKRFLKSHPPGEGSFRGGRSEYGQSGAMEILKGLQSRRQWGSMADLTGASPMSIDEWDVVRRASRLALDTSHHGSDVMTGLEGSCSAPMPISQSPVPLESVLSPSLSADRTSHSPVARPVPLQAVLEDSEELPMQRSASEQEELQFRGRSLIKDLLAAQGTPLGEGSPGSEVPVTSLDPKTHRIEQFLRSMFGVEDANEAQKVMAFLNLSLSSNVSEKDLMEGLAKLGYDVDENEVSFLVEIMAPGSDHINFTQFVASQIDWESLQQTHKEAWLECVRHAFESMDRDRDGTLSAEDIVGAIAEKLPNPADIDTALEQAKVEACAAELNMSFEDFLAVLRDEHTLPLQNFDSRFNALSDS